MSDQASSLFAYGSLQLTEVFEAVSLESREGVPAVLADFQRTKLRGFGFPALLPIPGVQTAGILYRSLGSDAWQRLDAFEDDFYERREVTVRLLDGALCEAFTYVLSGQYRHLSLDQEWSLDDLHSETIRDLLARL